MPGPDGRDSRPWWWVRLALGVGTVGFGLGALAAPDTARGVGLLFGLHLFVTGVLRVALGVAAATEPGAYRFCSGILGVEIAAVGIVCLCLPDASATMLMLLVSVGWLLAGLIGIAAGVSGGQPRSRWYARTGGAVTVTAVIVLVWPELGLTRFVSIGVALLVVTGIGETAMAAADIRAFSSVPSVAAVVTAPTPPSWMMSGRLSRADDAAGPRSPSGGNPWTTPPARPDSRPTWPRPAP